MKIFEALKKYSNFLSPHIDDPVRILKGSLYRNFSIKTIKSPGNFIFLFSFLFLIPE